MVKILNTLILVLLAGCASKGHWKSSYVNTGTVEYSSSKLIYETPDPNNNIKLEIFRTKDYCNGYITVESHPIAPYQNDPKKALVFLHSKTDSISYISIRHQGGQRILLPPDALERIVKLLLEGQSISIETSGYKTSIEPQGFSSKYSTFQSPSKIPKLIQLPF